MDRKFFWTNFHCVLSVSFAKNANAKHINNAFVAEIDITKNNEKRKKYAYLNENFKFRPHRQLP